MNTIKHADRVLQGMAGWDPVPDDPDKTNATASKAAATRDKAARPATASPKKGQRNKPR